MRDRWGIDVARGALIVAWLLLAVRMKDVIGVTELVVAGVLVVGSVIVVVWD